MEPVIKFAPATEVKGAAIGQLVDEDVLQLFQMDKRGFCVA